MNKIERIISEKIVAETTARMDGWKNILTGIGVKGRDRRRASKIEWEIMAEEDADQFYAGSDLARKIVDEVVEEAFREGYKLKADDLNEKAQKSIEDEEQRLQVDSSLQEAWRLARMYGGSAIIPIPRDVNLLAQPMIPESIDKIHNLLVLSRWELPRVAVETDIRKRNFARPQTYRICPRTGADQMNYEVHHSWMVRFDGAYLPRIKYFQNNLWYDSILNVCRVPIRDYDAALAAVSSALDDFSVGVMKISNLTRSISEDRDDIIQKRLEIINLAKSIAKMIIIDADKEDFMYQNRTLTGVSDCVKLVAGRLVVASNMPHTKILGESPQGSNATGNSTTKDWYDHVGSQQENYLDPKLIALWRILLAVKKSPTRGLVPEGLKAEYTPLWQEPESVQAEVKNKTAMADQVYLSTGVLDPQEVADSRFGSGKFSGDIKLADSRKKRVLPATNEPAVPGAGKPGAKAAGSFGNPLKKKAIA